MNILILAAHPDDEVLGAGASISRWVRHGHQVSVLFFTDGVGARKTNAQAAKARKKAALKAADILGYEILGMERFPDNQLDSVPLLKITQAIESAKAKFQPELVCTHFWGDLNIDHRRVYEATLTAFRPQPGEICKKIISFEVASSTEWGGADTAFRPNLYNEVHTADLEKAVKAYEAYKAEVRADPHSRSVEAFSARRTLRGREVGVPLAEAFAVTRELLSLQTICNTIAY